MDHEAAFQRLRFTKAGCSGSDVFFLTQNGWNLRPILPHSRFEPTEFLSVPEAQAQAESTDPITKYIVYTQFLMVLFHWPAPAVVRSGFADPLVGMVIAVTG